MGSARLPVKTKACKENEEEQGREKHNRESRKRKGTDIGWSGRGGERHKRHRYRERYREDRETRK